MVLEVSKNNFGVTILKLNRPDKLNSLNLDLIKALIKELRIIYEDPMVRVVLITGKGKAFSAGGDITEMKSRFGKAMQTKNRLDQGLNEIIRLIRNIKRPIVSAVHGACFGAGMVLALSCDVIYAAKNAKFGFTYANIGLIPEGSYFMARYLGLHIAKELIFSNTVLSGEDAAIRKLINQAIDTDDLNEFALQQAINWAKGPVNTFGQAKEVLNRGFESDLNSHLDYESLAQGASFTTDEHKEGVLAFLEKRTPSFQ